MTALKHYGVGVDGANIGIGGCPFNMEKIQKDYIDGASTPTKIKFWSCRWKCSHVYQN
jgi:hypothetical protein